MPWRVKPPPTPRNAAGGNISYLWHNSLNGSLMESTKVSHRIGALSPSATLAMSQRCGELKARGVDVIDLSVGEPDFFTPEPIKAAAKAAIDGNFSFYSPVAGYADLRKAIAAKLKRDNGLDYAVEQIVVSSGAKQAVCNALLCIVNPGDEVIVPAPYWTSYVEMVKLSEGTPVVVPTAFAGDYKLTPAQLAAALTPRSKALILCSPSNPTGSVYSRDELQALAEVIARHPQLMVLSDEIYEHISYVGAHCSIAQSAALRDRTALINGVSKAYAMTGWRIGYLAAPRWLAEACTTLQGQYTSGASSIAQKAAVAALTGSQNAVTEMCRAFRRRRDLLVTLCRDIPHLRFNVPQGAFYLFPEVNDYFGRRADNRTIADADALAMYLLDKAHVATVSGNAFGAPNCLRLSYAASDNCLAQAVDRIKRALADLS